MGDVLKIYPQWQIEIERLLFRIKESPGDLRGAIEEWFHETVFLLGVEYRESLYSRAHIPEEHRAAYDKSTLDRLGREIASKIIEVPGMYTDQIEESRFERARRISVLVLGRPQFIRDNETGKVRFIRNFL